MPPVSILVVDDEHLFCTFLEKILGDAGYSVCTAVNGLEALDLFQREQPDIVMTDLLMPDMDGLALTRNLRELSPSTPVIIMSGAGTVHEVIEALRLGAHDYLTKPIVDKELLLHAVRKASEHLQMSRLADAYQKQLCIDVEQKTASLQEELKRRIEVERKLRQAKEEWEMTFNAIPDLIALIDREYRLFRVNKAMADFLGCSPAEAVGLRCCDAMHRLPHPPEFCPHSRLLQDGEPHQIDVYDENMGGFFEINVAPLSYTDGTLFGSIHLMRDISERKRKEEEQSKLQAQLHQAQKMESVGQLAAGIAHEINTPIQFIGTNNEFLAESFASIEQLIDCHQRLYTAVAQGTASKDLMNEVEQVTEEIDWEYLAEEIPLTLEQNKNGVQRVASIVMAMKEFSHPSAKAKEQWNINKLIDTTLIVARNEWKYVADVTTCFDENLPLILCNADELNQVFLNIIVNAAHAIEEKLGKTPDTGKGGITITTKQYDGGVEIRISDTGAGIPESILNKIFNPFFTTKKQGRGTGQGLAIARDIIEERHNGEITIETVEGEGSTFILRLPG